MSLLSQVAKSHSHQDLAFKNADGNPYIISKIMVKIKVTMSDFSDLMSKQLIKTK